MNDGELNQMIRHLLTIVLNLDGYPQELIDAFCQAFVDSVKNKPLGSPYIPIADTVNGALIPYHQQIRITEADEGVITTDVQVIKDNKTFVINSLRAITTQINGLTNNDPNIIKELKLNTMSAFYQGRESTRIKNLDELLLIVKQKPILAPAVITVSDFVTKVSGFYTTKTDNKTSVTEDVSTKQTLIQTLKSVMQGTYFDVCKLNLEDLSKVADYLKASIIDGRTKTPGSLLVNEYMINIAAGLLLSNPQVRYKYTSIFKLENKALGDGMIFLSTTANPTSVPDYAKLIKAGETIYILVADMGVRTQYYLIIAAVTPGQDVVIKLTVEL